MRTLTKEICKDYVEKLREGLDSNGISLNEEIYLLALEYTLLKWCEPGGLAERDINGWIKCSDSMPELEEEVLCCDEFDNYEVCHYAMGYIGGGPYLFCSEGVFDATHWQPLPKLPTSVR